MTLFVIVYSSLVDGINEFVCGILKQESTYVHRYKLCKPLGTALMGVNMCGYVHIFYLQIS